MKLVTLCLEDVRVPLNPFAAKRVLAEMKAKKPKDKEKDKEKDGEKSNLKDKDLASPPLKAASGLQRTVKDRVKERIEKLRNLSEEEKVKLRSA
jgi:hypothetical protein